MDSTITRHALQTTFTLGEGLDTTVRIKCICGYTTSAYFFARLAHEDFQKHLSRVFQESSRVSLTNKKIPADKAVRDFPAEDSPIIAQLRLIAKAVGAKVIV